MLLNITWDWSVDFKSLVSSCHGWPALLWCSWLANGKNENLNCIKVRHGCFQNKRDLLDYPWQKTPLLVAKVTHIRNRESSFRGYDRSKDLCSFCLSILSTFQHQLGKLYSLWGAYPSVRQHGGKWVRRYQNTPEMCTNVGHLPKLLIAASSKQEDCMPFQLTLL